MGLPLIDLSVALFFLLCLVIVARFRRAIQVHDAESYRFLSGGLAVLSLVSLLRIYSGLGIFATVPFLSDPLFFKVISWIGIIMGATFLVSGVSTWLPIARANRQSSQEQVQRLELIKRVEQLVMVETRLPEVLCTTLDYISGLSGVAWGAVFACDTPKTPARLLSTTCADDPDAAELVQLQIKPEEIVVADQNDGKEPSNLFDHFTGMIAPPDLALPLQANNRVYGVFLIWMDSDDTTGCDELRINLKIAVDIISRELELDTLRTRVSIMEHFRKLRRDLASSVDKSLEFRDNFANIARTLSDRLCADQISLVISVGADQVRRLTIGNGRTVLDEIGIAVDLCPDYIREALSTGKPVIFDNKTNAESDSTMQCGLAVPVFIGGTCGAVLTAVRNRETPFNQVQRRLLLSSVTVVRDLLIDDEQTSASIKAERRMVALEKMLMETGAGNNLQELFSMSARLLHEELGASIVRIATYSPDNAFLRSRALVSKPSQKPSTPPDGHMILSLMPLHRQLRDTGKIVLAGLNQPEQLSGAEASQVFTESSLDALLVPVPVGRRVLAVVSIAGMQTQGGSHRSADIMFARVVANAVGLAIQNGLSRNAVKSTLSRADRTRMATSSRLRGQVNSSLSGILGSLEMIKSRHQPGDAKLDKYLAIIDKSAHRIQDYLSQPVEE